MKKNLQVLLLLFTFNISIYANNTLVPFILEDQFEQKYTQNDFLGETFILLGASPDIKDLHKDYKIALINKLSKKYTKKIKIISVFNMQRVPSLFRYFAMSKFPDEKKKKILIDWQGKLTKDYNFDDKTLDILIFNKNGDLFFRLAKKEFDKKTIDEIVSLIKDILWEK